MSDTVKFWLGPGIVKIDGKKIRPGEPITKKGIPVATWTRWVKEGKVGAPAVAIKPDTETVRKSEHLRVVDLLKQRDKDIADLEKLLVELQKTIEDLKNDKK